MIKKNDFKLVVETLRANKVSNLELLYLTSILRKAIKDPEIKLDDLYSELKKKLNK